MVPLQKQYLSYLKAFENYIVGLLSLTKEAWAKIIIKLPSMASWGVQPMTPEISSSA
jgi:hypothetical protein